MKSKTVVAFVIVLLCYIPDAIGNEDDGKLFDTNFYAKKLVDDFGSDGYISVKQLEGLISSIRNQVANKYESDPHKGNDHSATNEYSVGVKNGAELSTRDYSDCHDATEPEKCVSQTVGKFKWYLFRSRKEYEIISNRSRQSGIKV